jgi:hypothetical protein
VPSIKPSHKPLSLAELLLGATLDDEEFIELELGTKEELLLGSIISPFCELLELLPLLPSSPEQENNSTANSIAREWGISTTLNARVRVWNLFMVNSYG